MKTTKTDRRRPDQRRWGMATGFPVMDSNGEIVVTERRALPDRRLDNTTLEQRMVMFAGMARLETE